MRPAGNPGQGSADTGRAGGGRSSSQPLARPTLNPWHRGSEAPGSQEAPDS